MQENEFEKRMQQKMEGFTLLPNEDVWNGVQARIRKDKHRKALIIWVVAGILLLGGAGAWWYVNDVPLSKAITSAASKPAANNHPINSSTAYDSNINKQSGTGEESIRQGRQSKKTEVPGNSAADLGILKKRRSSGDVVTKKSETEYNDHKKASTSLSPQKQLNSTGIPSKSSNTANIVKADLSNNISEREINSASPLHRHYKSPSDLLKDSIERSLAAKNTAAPVAGSLPLAKSKAPQQKDADTKRWKVGITLYGGMSDNVAGVKIFSAKSSSAFNDFNSASSPSPTNSTPSPARIPPLQHKSSASFGVGALVKRRVSKRLDLSIGLDYHHFSTTSRVGYKVSGNRSVYDSTLNKQASVEATYGNGQTTTFTNKYHLLQLPFDIGYRLNGNTNKPITFSLGVAPAFMVASNALYLNRGANVYYEDKHQFKSFMLFGQSSIMFSAMSTRKFTINAGPVFQYGFNSFSKWQTGTSQHLIFTGIKTNIILK